MEIHNISPYAVSDMLRDKAVDLLVDRRKASDRRAHTRQLYRIFTLSRALIDLAESQKESRSVPVNVTLSDEDIIQYSVPKSSRSIDAIIYNFRHNEEFVLRDPIELEIAIEEKGDVVIVRDFSGGGYSEVIKSGVRYRRERVIMDNSGTLLIHIRDYDDTEWLERWDGFGFAMRIYRYGDSSPIP